MGDANDWFRLVLAILATWRVTHLLANEDGPGDVVVRLRARLGSGFAGRLMDCFHCVGMWVAVPFSIYVGRDVASRAIAWLALAGAASLLERITESRERVPLLGSPQGEPPDGMLWTEARDAEGGDRRDSHSHTNSNAGHSTGA